MFYYLNGVLALLSADKAVIDCGGVGYLLSITKQTYDRLVSEGAFTANGEMSGVKVKLFTYYHVREDAVELFGFFSEEECDLFKLLIGISGVGPKAAIAILSALSPASLVRAVLSQDAKAISAAQGIGLKSAQKIILELKDKLAKFPLGSDDMPSFAPASDEPDNDTVKEAVDALTTLGYTRAEAQKAVKAASGASVEDIIRSALMNIGN